MIKPVFLRVDAAQFHGLVRGQTLNARSAVQRAVTADHMAGALSVFLSERKKTQVISLYVLDQVE